MLLRGEETLDQGATERLWSLLAQGDPGAEGGIAWRVNEPLRAFSCTRDLDGTATILGELVRFAQFKGASGRGTLR